MSAEKNTQKSKYLKPAVGWGIFAAALVVILVVSAVVFKAVVGAYL